MYKVFNKTYQPFNLLSCTIPARKAIMVEELDKQLLGLEEKELVKITKIPPSKDK